MVFETAVYTDVTQDESVDGLDGFRFQALSPGLGGDDRTVIVDEMLHRNSAAWPRDRDETEHPPTTVYHRTDHGFYFSRGIATGRTNTGRDGNQLTQAVVAHDEADLEPYRPAQLHAAVNWRLSKAPSRTSQTWAAPLEIDEAYESTTLIETLQEDPWAMEVLPAFLSMLHDALADQNRKVVVVHDDLDVVMKWFATGTSLLPTEDALRLGYRAFVSDPFRVTGQLIGIHPDLRKGSLTGAHVIDLLAHTVSDVTITRAARRIAEWVRQHDAFDALEAAALGGRWMKAFDADEAADGAEMVLELREVAPGRDEWTIGIALIEGLGAAGLGADLELYLDELSESVASYRIRGGDDAARAARAARYAADSGVAGLVEAVLEPSLEALTADPSAAAAWAGELAASGGWQRLNLSEPRRIAELFTDLIVGSAPEALPSLLRLAAALSTHLSEERLRPALSEAAAYVLTDPRRLSDDIATWYGGAMILADLRHRAAGALADRRDSSRAGLLRELGAGEWDGLIPEPARTDDERALAMWRTATRVAAVPVDKRGAAVAEAMSPSGVAPGALRLQPECWDVALGEAAVPVDLLIVWIREVGLDDTLRNRCLSMLSDAMNQDLANAKTRDLKSWIRLAEALQEREPDCADHAETIAALQNALAQAPSKVSKATTAVKGFFSGHSGNTKEGA